MPFFRLLILVLFLTGPVWGQENTASNVPEEDLTQIVDDVALERQIGAMLGQLDGYETVQASVRAGVVTLSGEVLDSAQAAELETMISRLDRVAAIQNGITETTDVTRRLNPAADRVASRFTQITALAPLLVVAALAAGIVSVLGFLIARMNGPWVGLAPNPFIAEIYRQVIRLAFIVAGLVLALDILGATALLGTILGAAGIVGLAIGFAVRDTVENFIASVMLSIRQPFSPNDMIEIDGDLGKVIRLTSRATILLSLDGNHIRIPNATVFKSRIINYSRNRERRFTFDVGVEYGCDLAAVRSLVEETVQKLPFVLTDPAASAWIQELSDAGVLLRVSGWIDQHATSFSAARGSAIRQVMNAIEAAGVEIPDTTYRILLDGAGLPSPNVAGAKAPKVAPKPIRTDSPVEDVRPEDDEALERMVDAERDDDQRPDLLKDGAALE